MGVLDWYKKSKTFLSKEVRLFSGSELAAEDSMALLPSWFWTAKLGVPRNTNLLELRQYAKSPWVQMVKAAIKKQIMSIDWDVIPTDEEDETDYSEQIKQIKTFLKYPNRNKQTFWELWGMFMDDVLDLDAGVIVKGRNGAGELKELFAHDGGKFLFKTDKYGIIEGMYQYSFQFPTNKPLFFERDDIIYGKVGNNTDQYPYGWSPLQSIQQEIEVMIQSTRFNKEFFKNNAIPDGILSVNTELENLERFQKGWAQQCQGKAHKLVIHNSDATFTPLGMNNKDMEWLEGQKWYFHVCFAAYGLSPQEVGFYENSNRSTGESQERISIKNAIKPYLILIEEKINREIIPDITGNDDIKFKFFPNDDTAEKIKHDQAMAKLNAGVITINELRSQEGLNPVKWGDQPMAMEMQDRFKENQPDEEDKDNPKEEKPKEEDKEKERTKREEKKELKKKVPNIQEEAKDYADFLKKEFNKWEKEIMSFIDDTLSDEFLSKSNPKLRIEKTFGEFLMRLMNTIHTAGFFESLKAVVTATLKQGTEAAEKELKVDIGVGINFEKKAEALTQRQLDGFSIEGKRWNGIKGVAKDVQDKIREKVAKGITDQSSLKEIKNEVKDIMVQQKGGKRVTGEVTEGRAMKIARTESNRFVNQGKLAAYKDSGLKGKKKWNAFEDNRTSKICLELDEDTVELDDNFKASVNGKYFEFDTPPAHPNCRSIIQFVQED